MIYHNFWPGWDAKLNFFFTLLKDLTEAYYD